MARIAVARNTQKIAVLEFRGELEKTLADCVRDNSPHHLTTYLTELAALFHSFYDKHKVLDPENKEVTAYRLFLLKSVKGVIARGLAPTAHKLR